MKSLINQSKESFMVYFSGMCFFFRKIKTQIIYVKTTMTAKMKAFFCRILQNSRPFQSIRTEKINSAEKNGIKFHVAYFQKARKKFIYI